jgi:hypothetical protein
MTLATLLDKTGARAARQLEKPLEAVDAVFDDELWKILSHYGLLEPLDRGELRCHISGVPLTRENVGGLIGTPQGPRLIADQYLSVAEPTAATR